MLGFGVYSSRCERFGVVSDSLAQETTHVSDLSLWLHVLVICSSLIYIPRLFLARVP